MELQEDSLVLCTVDGIEHMTVFVKLPDGRRGTIVTSEIAPGRIKNIREYVSPNKIIVCKVLRISGDHIDLSLRRVTSKEKKEVLEKHQQEKSTEIALKSLLKEKAIEIITKIKQDFETFEQFLEKTRENEKIIGAYIPKELIENFKKITEKKKKQVEVKKILKLKCWESDGIKKIKDILKIDDQSITITYISAGNYLISVKEEDYKKANPKIQNLIEEIEKRAKKCSCEISVEEKK